MLETDFEVTFRALNKRQRRPTMAEWAHYGRNQAHEETFRSHMQVSWVSRDAMLINVQIVLHIGIPCMRLFVRIY